MARPTPGRKAPRQAQGQLCLRHLLPVTAQNPPQPGSAAAGSRHRLAAADRGPGHGLGWRKPVLSSCCCLGLRTKSRGGVQARGAGADQGPRGGLAVAWRLSRTWAWPRGRGLLQGHQVSPGAAGTQAHLQGHLWAAARGEHQTPPRPHSAQAGSLQTDARPQGQADRLTARSHPCGFGWVPHLSCRDLRACGGGAGQGALLPGGLAGPERCRAVLPGPCAGPWAAAQQLPLGRWVGAAHSRSPCQPWGYWGSCAPRERSPPESGLHPSATAGGRGERGPAGSRGTWGGLQPRGEAGEGSSLSAAPPAGGSPGACGPEHPSGETGAVAGMSVRPRGSAQPPGSPATSPPHRPSLLPLPWGAPRGGDWAGVGLGAGSAGPRVPEAGGGAPRP